MDNRLRKIQDQLIEQAGELAGSIALNPVVGQLYALLYFSPETVSLDDMVDRLKISKGNASVNIRALEDWGAVRKVWVKGSRKDYYTAEPDIWKIVVSRLNNGLSRRMGTAMDGMEEIKKDIGKAKEQLARNRKGDLQFFEKRLKKLEELSTLARNLLKFLPTLSSPGIIEKGLKFFGGK